MPGPCWGGNFDHLNHLGKIVLGVFFLKCRSNEMLKLCAASTNERMVVELPMKWHERIHAQLTEWTNKTMNQLINGLYCCNESVNHWSLNQWTKESTNQCINRESMNQWMTMNQRINQWIRDSLNQWNDTKQLINEPVNQLFNESVNQWFHEAMSLRNNESTNQWIDELMNQWINQGTSESTKEPVNQWFNESMNQQMGFVDIQTS